MTSRSARMHEFTWKDDAKRDSSEEYVRTESFIPWLLGGLASLVLIIGVTAVFSLNGRPSLGAGPETLPLDRNWEVTMAVTPAEAPRAFNPPAAKAPAVSAPETPRSFDEPVEAHPELPAPKTDDPTEPTTSPIHSGADEQSPAVDSDNPY